MVSGNEPAQRRHNKLLNWDIETRRIFIGFYQSLPGGTCRVARWLLMAKRVRIIKRLRKTNYKIIRTLAHNPAVLEKGRFKSGYEDAKGGRETSDETCDF